MHWKITSNVKDNEKQNDIEQVIIIYKMKTLKNIE